MKVIVYTEHGIFESKSADLTEDEQFELMKLLKTSVSDGDYLSLETDRGHMILGKVLLQSALIEVVE